jgi:APA family basic amino acid/polyamine antiporter
MVLVSARGVLRGTAPCFFGYVGYDEVCCLAGEAKDPEKNLPVAVFSTIIIVTIVYFLSSITLVGMQNYNDINAESGFSEGFRVRGLSWARHTVAIGEIITLPLVALVSFLAQPRLFFAMSQDGQLPEKFSRLDSKGNLKDGIVLSGVACTVIALFVPFQYLDELISTGVLLSFNLTNASLIILRNSASSSSSSVSSSSVGSPTNQTKWLLLLFNISALLVSYMITNLPTQSLALLVFILVLVMIFSITIVYAAYYINVIFTSLSSSPSSSSLHNDKIGRNHYMTPFMPWIPLTGSIINCILISQISTTGILIAVIYFVLASVVYFLYGLQNSKLNSINKSLEFEFTTISSTDNDDDEDDVNPIINPKRF